MNVFPASNNKDARLDVSICIATFRRPRGLERLLDHLQIYSGINGMGVEVVVVDNDAGGTARPVVEHMSKKLECIRYFVEPRQNIAHARNCAVRQARGAWVAFIDDDEVPGNDWLTAYWRMTGEMPGDGYFGPVIPHLEGTVPSWMERELFFGRPRFATGTRLSDDRQMRTGNAFIRRSIISSFQFDCRYGLTGGADSELFGRMARAGAKFYWCDGAETYEYYPVQRLSLRWVVQRAFRGGYTYTLIQRKRQHGFWQQIPGLVKAVGGGLLFTLMLPLEILRGRKCAAWRLVRLSVQIGHIWAFLNLRYEEYRVKNRGTISGGVLEGQGVTGSGQGEGNA